MQVAALCYCNRNLTDGFVPWAAARTLLSWEYIEGGKAWRVGVTSGPVGDDVDADRITRILVAAGLWHEVEGGYQVHDYEDYQPTRQEVLELSAKRQAAGQAGGLAKAKQLASNALANDVAELYPVPVPVYNSSLSTSSNPPSKKIRTTTAREAQITPDLLDELRIRFYSLDFDWEYEKWQDYVAEKPPKGNWKLSLKNWLERCAPNPNYEPPSRALTPEEIAEAEKINAEFAAQREGLDERLAEIEAQRKERKESEMMEREALRAAALNGDREASLALREAR
jgi:hypothetical protein